MKQIIIGLFLLLFIGNTKAVAQEEGIRLNFVLLIDNEVATPSVIKDEYFLIKSSASTQVDSIPFKYNVGCIMIPTYDYLRFFGHSKKDSVFLKFTYAATIDYAIEDQKYIKRIPPEFINPEYLIVKVFNYFNPESRAKYYLKKDAYGIELDGPGFNQTIPRWAK